MVEDIAAEAGITKLIIYRHFDSKRELYEAVLRRTQRRLVEEVGGPDGFTVESLGGLLQVAREDPDAFRLLFHHAAHEPEFAPDIQRLTENAVAVAARYLGGDPAEQPFLAWRSRLAFTWIIEAVIDWIEVGDPAYDEEMLARLRAGLRGLAGRSG
jgi:AcrR family transcriptional regulator